MRLLWVALCALIAAKADGDQVNRAANRTVNEDDVVINGQYCALCIGMGVGAVMTYLVSDDDSQENIKENVVDKPVAAVKDATSPLGDIGDIPGNIVTAIIGVVLAVVSLYCCCCVCKIMGPSLKPY